MDGCWRRGRVRSRGEKCQNDGKIEPPDLHYILPLERILAIRSCYIDWLPLRLINTAFFISQPPPPSSFLSSLPPSLPPTHQITYPNISPKRPGGSNAVTFPKTCPSSSPSPASACSDV